MENAKEIIASELWETVMVLGSLKYKIDIIISMGKIIIDVLRNDGKLIIFGNGGSAADAQHIAAEFIGRFYMDRKPLPAIALPLTQPAVIPWRRSPGSPKAYPCGITRM